MASRPIKIQVKVPELYTAIEEHDKKCQADWEKAMKAYRLELSSWKKDTMRKLRAAATLLEVSDSVENLTAEKIRSKNGYRDYTGWETTINDLKTPPRRPTKPKGNESFLKLLDMSAKDTYMLSEEQFDTYMRGCRL